MDRSPQFRRLWLLSWGLCAGFAVVAVRLVYLQALMPRETGPRSAPEPEIEIKRPALRGEIRDATGATLVQSRLAVVVRADPVQIGPFAPELARLAAPYLELPEAEVLARLQPVQVPQTNAVLAWSGGRPVTNLQVVMKTRRSNLVATNVSVAAWDQLFAALQTNDFPAQVALRRERDAIRARVRQKRDAVPWWDLPARWMARREASLAERDVQREIRLMRRDLLPCRRKGLFPEFVHLRQYPHDHLAAHVLGFTTNNFDPDARESGLPIPMSGAQGLEQRCQELLEGSPGLVRMRLLLGREYVPSRGRDVPSRDGNTLLLTLDLRIQEAVERALDEAMARLNPSSMCAIVVRPSTGDILALANRPTFNPNQRRGESMEAFKNRALTESFEPGSTFKIVTLAAVLNEGRATLEEPIDCHFGRWAIPGLGRTIHDDQGHHLGVVSVEEAFAHSSNVGAVALSLRLQTNQFLRYIRDFGFLERTGIECAELRTNWVPGAAGRPRMTLSFGETPGRLPSWDRLTASSLAFGYGLRVTPLQSVMAAAALANGGVLMKPRLVQKILTPDGQSLWENPAQAVRTVVRPATAAQMVRALCAAVDSGTGKAAALEDFEVAGKTGTAKLAVKGRYTTTDYYASFLGFFPAHRPEVAIIVTADRPTTAGKAYYGGKACAPAFRAIASEVANILQLAPTVIRSNTVTAGWSGRRPALTDLSLERP
ncbi:MAG: hypothetical protein KIT22_07765 [Verrucomicrobiae bacterium]|nr:hypothetical protein [Verrucomicrobiae bacterium]